MVIVHPSYLDNRASLIKMQSILNFNELSCCNVKNKLTVCAASVINENSTTEIVNVHRIAENNTMLLQNAEIAESNGRMVCTGGQVNPTCWIKHVQISSDCQTTNVQLVHDNRGVYLQALRTIKPGEILFMWFSDTILNMMEIPGYLNPFNIIDKNRYQCGTCKSIMEYPNTLKIHIGLNCDSLPLNNLWKKMSNNFNSSLNLSRTLTTFKFELKPSTIRLIPTLSPKNHHDKTRQYTLSPLSSSSSSSLDTSTLNQWNRLSPLSHDEINHQSSAFKLYNKKNKAYKNDNLLTSRNNLSPNYLSDNSSPYKRENLSPYSTTGVYHVQPDYHQNDVVISSQKIIPINYHYQQQQQQQHQHQSICNLLPSGPVVDDAHAAHIETIFSNIGKSGDGHRCVYCGKIYSRKYGLKIHLRTHTGFKPLKCKYCLRPFGDPSNLNKHMRLHAEDTNAPYKCDICGKGQIRRRDLERHMKAQHDQLNNSAGNETEFYESEVEIDV